MIYAYESPALYFMVVLFFFFLSSSHRTMLRLLIFFFQYPVRIIIHVVQRLQSNRSFRKRFKKSRWHLNFTGKTKSRFFRVNRIDIRAFICTVIQRNDVGS